MWKIHKFGGKKIQIWRTERPKYKEDKCFTFNFNPNFLRQSVIHSTYCLLCGFNFLMVTERKRSGYPKVLMFGSFQDSARCSRGLWKPKMKYLEDYIKRRQFWYIHVNFLSFSFLIQWCMRNLNYFCMGF